MTMKKLIELVRDYGGRDVELVIYVRDGAVTTSVQKVRRTKAEVHNFLFFNKGKQMAVGRQSSRDPHGSMSHNDLDYVATEAVQDLAESALAAAVTLHGNES